MPTLKNDTAGSDEIAVHGHATAAGVLGESETWHGVVGFSKSNTGGFGVHGQAIGPGVVGESETWHGVHGLSESTTGGHGVLGQATGTGVAGVSQTWIGVYGETNGTQNGPSGVLGEGKTHGVGVKGHASGANIAAVAGYHLTHSGPGIYGEGAPAGLFIGDVHVSGNITAGGDISLVNADCAEDFDVAADQMVEPGMVMVLADDGRLRISRDPYDRRVAGVVAGAGTFRPGIVLDKQADVANRQPIALLGKTWCMVDATFGAIKIGDLLTTSSSEGHAMRAGDPLRSFGAIIGKALRHHTRGRGLIPILIALQ